MKCTILLHSTTGNTRLVAKFAAAVLQEAGYETTLYDIVKAQAPPDFGDVDLLGVACPTMYWRPTVAMERFVARMPVAPRGKTAAFLIGTAGGDIGAHFPLLAEQLVHKDFVVLGAVWAPLPNNYPPSRAAVRFFSAAEPFAAKLGSLVRALRRPAAFLWPNLTVPSTKARDRLRAELSAIAENAKAGRLAAAPDPTRLPTSPGVSQFTGRLMTVEYMRWGTAPKIDAEKCTRCGICVEVCPVGCITRPEKTALPTLGANCTGCWTCYNRCPDGAIAGFMTPAGVARYAGPPKAWRDVWAVPKAPRPVGG